MGSHSAKHERQYRAWYAADRSFARVAVDLQVPERTLRFWCEKEEWHRRADRCDRQAAKLADRAAVRTRAAYLISVGRGERPARGIFPPCQYLPASGAKLREMAAQTGFSSQEPPEKQFGC